MISKIKQNERFQVVLRIANYFVSIGLLALFFEGETMVLDNKFILIYRKVFNFIYTRNIQFFSLFMVGILSLFLLKFKRNNLIKVSFILNTIIMSIGIFGGIISYFAY